MNRTHITIINQAVDFIIDNLFEKITIERVADHCCFSRYYFNRLFRSVTGESIYSFIKRLRLEAAAFKLIKAPHLSITSVAAELGYSSSNFTVLFKKYYGLSPSQFRFKPKLPSEPGSNAVLKRIMNLQKDQPVKLLKQMDQQISFEEIPDIKLMYKRFKGNYQDLSPVWKTFCEKIKHSFSDSPIEFYGISYDDPLIVGEDNCLYDLCARVTESAKIEGENYRKIPKGLHLCYHFNNHVRKLNLVYNNLFAVWMPHRGYIMGQGLCFERYYSASNDNNIIMDLCIPILSKSKAQIQK
jgi:AraC family transcriptional regulator